MTKRQEIWMEIAEAFGTPRGERTKRQEMLAYTGLCRALEIMIEPNRVKLFKTYDEVDIFQPRRLSKGYWYPHWKAGEINLTRIYHDSERCQFALLMATISDEDYAEMVK